MVTRPVDADARFTASAAHLTCRARRLLAGASLVLFPFVLSAQQAPHANAGNFRGGFGAPVLSVTRVAGQTAAFIGGRGAWILSDRFAIGAGAYSLIGEQVESHFLLGGAKTHLEYGYGGLELEYYLRSHDQTHATVQLLLGAGGANWSLGGSDPIDDDRFLITEPAVNLERNVSQHIRVAVGMAYRFVAGVDLIDLTSKDLGGPSLLVTCKLGAF
ncbi:MAG: hypothetical protein U0132_04450 [Gemmatimonadaceae bacterium]